MPVLYASYGSEFPLIPPGPGGSFTYWGGGSIGERGTRNHTYTWGDTGTGNYLGILPLPSINEAFSTTGTFPCSDYPSTDTPNPTIWDIYTITASTATTATTQASTVSTTTVSSTCSNTGSLTLVTPSYRSAPTPQTTATNASETHLTGHFWVVPSGYTGGSELSDFSTVTQATLNSITQASTARSEHPGVTSLGGYNVLTNSTEPAVVTTCAEVERLAGIGYETFCIGFTGTTYGAVYRLGTAYGESIGSSLPPCSFIHPNILDAISFTDWTTGNFVATTLSYKFSNSTQIIYTTTASTATTATTQASTVATTSNLDLSVLSTTASSQSIAGETSFYWGVGVAGMAAGAFIYVSTFNDSDGVFQESQLWISHAGTLPGGQTWTAGYLYGRATETDTLFFPITGNPPEIYGITSNFSNGSTAFTTFTADSAWTSTFSIESGGNIVIGPRQIVSPVDSATSHYLA